MCVCKLIIIKLMLVFGYAEKGKRTRTNRNRFGCLYYGLETKEKKNYDRINNETIHDSVNCKVKKRSICFYYKLIQ